LESEKMIGPTKPATKAIAPTNKAVRTIRADVHMSVVYTLCTSGGWRLVYNGFRQTCALRGATVDAERAQQGPLLLVSANCPQVISAMPLLTRDNIHPGKLEDVLKTNTIHDDVGDCLRYGYKSMLDPKSQAPREARL